MDFLKRIIGTLMLVSIGSVANAGSILDFEGTNVDFYSSWLNSNTLRIEIDAGSRTGGWTNAFAIDSIAINAPKSDWSWSSASDITLTGPNSSQNLGGVWVNTPSYSYGDMNGWGLDADGCQNMKGGKNHPCWSVYALLADDMYFDFTFAPGVVLNQIDNPHLKVRFVDENGSKVGSLLSEDLNTVTVAEPSIIALFGMGLIGLFFVRRKIA